MPISSYEEVYELIKKYGPITFHQIRDRLSENKKVDKDTMRLSHSGEIGGYVACLQQADLIKCIEPEQSAIRKCAVGPRYWHAI